MFADVAQLVRAPDCGSGGPPFKSGHRYHLKNFLKKLEGIKMPKINGNEIRPNNVLEHNGHLWTVVRVNHVKPGKGGAFAQVELKNIRSGSKLNERFRSADKVEKVRLEQKKQQFLYNSGDDYFFMDCESYEQVLVPEKILSDKKIFLEEGIVLEIEYFENEVLNVIFPEKIKCKVVETEPVVKGQTASNSFKPATLSNNLKIQVPPFISINEEIIVSSETMEYVERSS